MTTTADQIKAACNLLREYLRAGVPVAVGIKEHCSEIELVPLGPKDDGANPDLTDFGRAS